MIKYSPARKSKDIYSNELASEIANDLGINEADKISALKEILEEAYLYYVDAKLRQSRQATSKKEDKELLRFSKNLEKSIKILEKLFETSTGSSFRIINEIKNLKTIHEKEQAAILNLIRENKFCIYSDRIISLLDIIAVSAKNASKADHIFEKETDTEIVFFWMSNFIDFWEAFSKIRISEGRYEGEGIYDSPALRIIEKIIKPLNNHISDSSKITLSLVSEAIKLYRRDHDPETDFNPFIDDLKDIGQ